MLPDRIYFSFFFFNDTATTEIYTLSLHDALPIWRLGRRPGRADCTHGRRARAVHQGRSEEHTSELQSQSNLVCRLLLEKKNRIRIWYLWGRGSPTLFTATISFQITLSPTSPSCDT